MDSTRHPRIDLGLQQYDIVIRTDEHGKVRKAFVYLPHHHEQDKWVWDFPAGDEHDVDIVDVAFIVEETLRPRPKQTGWKAFLGDLFR